MFLPTHLLMRMQQADRSTCLYAPTASACLHSLCIYWHVCVFLPTIFCRWKHSKQTTVHTYCNKFHSNVSVNTRDIVSVYACLHASSVCIYWCVCLCQCVFALRMWQVGNSTNPVQNDSFKSVHKFKKQQHKYAWTYRLTKWILSIPFKGGCNNSLFCRLKEVRHEGIRIFLLFGRPNYLLSTAKSTKKRQKWLAEHTNLYFPTV